MPRKLSAIRQLSLQCESPPQPPITAATSARRASLKKQRSEELVHDDEIAIRVSMRAKAPHHRNRHAKNIRVAWDDVEDCGGALDAGSRVHSNATPDGENDLLASQQFRQAWQHEREKTNKLNIFLAQNVPPQHQRQPDSIDLLDTEDDALPVKEPKIMQPLYPLQTCSNNANLKHIFQKHMRKQSSKQNSPSGSDTESAHQQPIVVVPIIERISKPRPNQSIKSEEQRHSNYGNREEVVEEERVRLPTATAAAQKRAIFHNNPASSFQTVCASPLPASATNRASTFRPPFVRASSLPTSRTIANHNNHAISDTHKTNKTLRKKTKVIKRPKSAKDIDDDHLKRNSDVVTMVSLVSASDSDTEYGDVAPPPPASPKKTANTPQPSSAGATTAPLVNCWKPPQDEGGAGGKHFSLRKTVKQVSFQHSSIHAVRSFSASFPARRASVATSALLDDAVKKFQKSLEQRTNDGQHDSKRRLLRAASAMRDNTIHRHSSPQSPPTTDPEQRHAQDNTISKNGTEDNRIVAERNEVEKRHQEEEAESVKEKKCWETYCRMTRSGLTVSFDTILRGMLTPTEYRLRRRLSLQRSESLTVAQEDAARCDAHNNGGDEVTHKNEIG